MIRVLRVLEYDFEDPESAEISMSHWAVPPNGTKRFGNINTIRSAMILDLNPKQQTIGEEPKPIELDIRMVAQEDLKAGDILTLNPTTGKVVKYRGGPTA